MEATIKVTPEQLQQTADSVDRTIKSLRQDFTEMQTLVSRTGYYWTGTAADNYRKQFADKKERTESILTTLSDYPTDLLEIAGVYRQTETQNTSAAAALRTDFIT